MTETTHQIFRNRLAAARWMRENGYKIGKSKLYQDTSSGLLKVEPDGTVTIESVRRYIDHPEAGIREHLDTVQAGEDVEVREYHRRAAIAKAEKTELEAARLRFEMERDQKKWIPRDDLEMEVATRAVVFEQGFKNLIRIRLDDWVALVGGNVARAGELRVIINDQVDQLLNQYARADAWLVMFEEEG